MRQAAGGVASSRTENFFVFLTVDTRTHALGNAELERSYVDLDNRRGRLMIKRTLTIIFLSLSMAVPSEAAEQVRIAYNNLLPPFAEAKDGKAVGLVVDIVRAAAERAGYSVEFLPVPLEQMEASLKEGRALAAIPAAASPERRERMDFSDALMMTGGALYVRAPEPTPDVLKALAGKTVVTPRTGPLAAFIQNNAPEV